MGPVLRRGVDSGFRVDDETIGIEEKTFEGKGGG